MSGRRSLPANRKFVWAREQFDLTVTAEDYTIVDLLGDFQTEYGAQLIGSTIMRIRGLVELEPNAASSTQTAIAIRTSTDAEAVNSTSTENGPFTDQHADWMAYQPVIFNDAAPGLDGQIVRWEVDVKSARKLEELGQGLYLYIENTIVGVSLLAKGQLSVGLKLP